VKSTGSARGKIILLGEHAVVYGVPALVAGIDREARASVQRASSTSILLAGQPLEANDALFEALSQASDLYGLGPLELELELDLPSGSGLGASAALGVATARALAHLADRLDEATIWRAAMAWERVFHKNPSGVDTTAAMRGGVLRYVRGEDPTPVRLGQSLEISVCVAGPPAPTAAMVESVARLRDRRPEAFTKNLAAIAQLVENAEPTLRSGDERSLGRLMDLNHMLLSSWMLSTEEIEAAREIARGAGAFGSKLTGSGGGGAVLAVGPSAPILDAWRAAGYVSFVAKIGT